MRTKESAQNELHEKFSMRKTSDFLIALQKGKIEEAEAWLQYIEDNQEAFPQYQKNWDSWLGDRKKEIYLYRLKKEGGELENISPRSKEDAQKELFEKFGIKKTSDFRKALQNGQIADAELWLQYIIRNRSSFPHYEATWDSWLKDRQNEIESAKNKK